MPAGYRLDVEARRIGGRSSSGIGDSRLAAPVMAAMLA